MVSLLLLFYLLVPPSSGHYCTENDPDFDGVRYQENIPHCLRNVTTERKTEICLRDGVQDRHEFTVDHIIPLALGGSNDDSNLWCQHYSLAVTRLEYRAYRMLKDGEITHQEAVDMILKAKFKD